MNNGRLLSLVVPVPYKHALAPCHLQAWPLKLPSSIYVINVVKYYGSLVAAKMFQLAMENIVINISSIGVCEVIMTYALQM